MYSLGSAKQSSRSSKFPDPSEELRIGVTFRRPDGGPGPTKFKAPLSLESVKGFLPDSLVMDRAIYELSKLGFKLTGRGRLTVSMRCKQDSFKTTFGTTLEDFRLDTKENYAFHSLYFPPQGSPWELPPTLEDLIDDAYIQWPQIYMAPKKSAPPRKRVPRKGSAVAGRALPAARPPKVDYYHLKVPNDIAYLLNAKKVHSAGTTGKGIRVAMIDTGFAHGSHPFFSAHKFKSTVDLAPGAVNDLTDLMGHGTGESTNAFSVAPGATFIGVKIDNDDDPRRRASMLEAFQTALQHRPHIISVSKGSDLRDQESKRQLSRLPRSLVALEVEILAAVASGITVVFSAGNGQFAFPGMMPDVISAGGVFVDQNGNMQASDLASAFDSNIYSGRHVPDFCGLVGMRPKPRSKYSKLVGKLEPLDRYIMLPIPVGCDIDLYQLLDPDGTKPTDGWAAFSGTSAAAPQIAGVCALLKAKNPNLTPSDIKAILRRTARQVLEGNSNPKSSEGGKTPQKAGPGDDGAAGAGLVDAFRAYQEVI
jgi:subtilisin family serine protease